MEMWLLITVAISTSGAGIALALFIYERLTLRIAEPNEWLIVIRDGKMLKAGVGLRYRASYEDTVVTIPACVYKVQFQAQQVTKEMQGVELAGFVMWSVFREGDGPAKAYQFLDGMKENGLAKGLESIKNMAESIIRSQVANMNLQDVIKNRELVRDVARDSMLKVVKGWGVWLETVEITDVKVLSKSLFDNLQCSFREESRLAAELKKISTNREIEERRLNEQLQIHKKQVDSENDEKTYRAQILLQAKREEELLMVETNRIEMARIEKQNEMQAFKEAKDDETKIRRLEKDAEIQKIEQEGQKLLQLQKLEGDAVIAQRQVELEKEESEKRAQAQRELEAAQEKHAIELKALRAAAELELSQRKAEQDAKNLKLKLEAEKTMDNTNLKILALENTSSVYRNLASLKVVNLTGGGAGGGGGGSVEALIPGLLAINQALSEQ